MATVAPLCLAHSGCASAAGSLDDGTGGSAQIGEVCWTQSARAIGVTWVTNAGSGPVVLESAELGADGDMPLLTLTGAYIIRYPQEQLFGFGLEVPPDGYDDPDIVAEWDLREPLEGATVVSGEG